MRALVVRLAILSYPRRWRRRYGHEVEDLTIAVLNQPQPQTKRIRILLDLVFHGADERLRRADTPVAKTALTSTSAMVAGMFALASGLASDSVLAPNVQVAASIHLGAQVSLRHINGPRPTSPIAPGRIVVVVQNRGNARVSVTGAPSAVVINTESGRVVSVTRADR